MPRDGVKVELHLKSRPQPSARWARLWDFLLSTDDDGPAADQQSHQRSPKAKLDDVGSG